MKAKMMAKEAPVLGADLDYKAEWRKLLDENEKLHNEVDYLRAALKNTEADAEKMKAQLDIVRLIFGGTVHGR